MIGDSFLGTAIKEFYQLKNHPIKELRYHPYLTAHYNVEPFFSPVKPIVRSLLARFTHALARGLNDQAKLNATNPPFLPRYIVIFPDKDIVEDVLQDMEKPDYGITEEITDALKWLIVNINKMIDDRKENLVKLRPGAVSSASEPHLIWVQMLRRPENSFNKEVFSLTRKFNKILEEVIEGDKRSHILKVYVESNLKNFDQYGNITPQGYYNYWKIIDDTMKEFDLGLTELAPTKHGNKSSPREYEAKQDKNVESRKCGHYNRYDGKHDNRMESDNNHFHRNHNHDHRKQNSQGQD